MNAKTIFLTLLLILPILACAGGDSSSGGSSGSGATSRVGGDDEVLKLLPEDTTRIQVAAADAITGGSVPETMTDLFEGTWENYSLGGEDEIVTVDDVGKVVWAISPEGGIVMLGGSRIDFAAINQWLADEETNIGKTSYQGQEMWGNDATAMVVMQSDGYLVFGDTGAVKELLKVKARGTGSLADDSENSLKKAYEDAASGWYVSASSNCDELFPDLRSCEAYSITGNRGDEDYLVNVTWRFTFRSEQRAESQSLDIEDWIEDRNYEWDIDEVKADGVSVEAKMSGDEEDFTTRWIGTDNIYTPPILPTAVPEPESRNTNQSGTAPTATLSPSASATEAPAPTVAPLEEEALLKYEGICTSSIQSEGAIRSEWLENCFSYGSGLYYAYYYAFRINLPTTISIELTADVYAQLLLLQGPVGAWDVLESYASGNSGRIEFITHLPAGEYVIEVASDYLVNYQLSTYLEDSSPSPTSTPPVTAAPTASPVPPTPAPTATRLPTLAVFRSVNAGGFHTCGLKTDGSVACWGWNDYGQTASPGGSFSSVSAGELHTCGVKTGGSVACWGANDRGQATPLAGSFSSVSAGGWHTCGLKTDGSVACWGWIDYGQTASPGGSFSSVSAGEWHTCGVKTEGSVVCWGLNNHGETAPLAGSFSSVSAGKEHTCGVKTDGSVACWGLKDNGRATPPGGSFSSVSAGKEHTCGLKTDGSVACWGKNNHVQATPTS